MLQFITSNTERYSSAEQVQMVLEAGCRWVQLSRLAQQSADFTEEIESILEMCREAGAFLVLTGDVELCDKLRVHGVHLNPGDMTPREARERLGAHAVIGVTVTTAAEVIALRGADIDYVHIGPFGSRFSLEHYKQIVAEVRAADVQTPVVAFGDIPAEVIPQLLEAGVNGIALSATVTDAPDPALIIRNVLAIKR